MEELDEQLQLGYATKAYEGLNPEPSFEAQQIARGMKNDVKGYQAIVRDIALGKFADARAILRSAIKAGEISLLKEYLLEGRLEVYRGKYDEETLVLRQAADSSGGDPSILLEIAHAHLLEGEYSAAAKDCDEVINKFPASLATYALLAKTNTLLGAIRHAEGNYSAARDVLSTAKDYWLRTPNPDQLEVARTLNDLGQTLSDLGKCDAAEPLLLEGLRMRERNRAVSVLDLSESYNNLGLLYKKTNNFVEAGTNYNKSYNLLLSKFGPRHPEIAMEANNLGSLYYTQKNFDRAEVEYNEALELWESFLGHNHPDVGRALNNLGTVYFHQRKLAKADDVFSRALYIWNSDDTLRNHPYRGVILTNIAALRAEQKRYSEAEKLYKNAIIHLVKTTSKESPPTLYAVKIFAKFYRGRGMEKEERELIHTYKIRPEDLDILSAPSNCA